MRPERQPADGRFTVKIALASHHHGNLVGAAGEPAKVFVTDELASVQGVRHKASFVSYTIIDPQFDGFRCLSYGVKGHMSESRVHVLGVFGKWQT